MKPATAPTPSKPTTEKAGFSHELRETIRFRAYELYEERGKIDGRDLDDWRQAETELTQVKMKRAAAAA